ncbi:MAG: hypothetical protein E7445_06700 [Ruminococcaceae bacterium]|nr:hypothetical protein [Oscillospiraceae bacterium]
MKKFACLVLALAMVLSLSISANAVSPIEALDGTDAKDVTIVVDGSGAESPRYYVTVTWKDLKFTYNSNGAGKTWNPENHEYTYTTEPGWTSTAISDAIKVDNHSNVSVKVSTAKALGAGANGKDFTITPTADQTLTRAIAGTGFNTAPSISYDIALTNDDAPTDLTAGNYTLGTVTVTITAP